METSVSSRSLPPFAVLFGPTASGKSDILHSMSSNPPDGFCGTPPWFEVVSADSMQVYRGMDTGTAKPSLEERQRLPYHLIDVRDPDEQYTVGDFVRAAESCIRDIASRGRLPIVSGGTAFYIRSLVCGMPDTPPSDPGVRAEIERETVERGLQAMHASLAAVDPESARTIDPADGYRITRALEVYLVSGRPRSAFRAPETLRTGLVCRIYRLSLPREELYERINRRVDRMFSEGLEREVETLIRAGYGKDTQALRAIGYREFFTCHSPESARAAIKRNTRRYAKRQITFARQIPGHIDLSPTDRDTFRSGCGRLLQQLQKHAHNR